MLLKLTSGERRSYPIAPGREQGIRQADIVLADAKFDNTSNTMVVVQLGKAFGPGNLAMPMGAGNQDLAIPSRMHLKEQQYYKTSKNCILS